MFVSRFRRVLKERNSDERNRRWLYIPYDQCTDAAGPLSRENPAELGIILVENSWKAALRPYHKQKLALVIANLRHFALEQAERGIAVRHVVGNGPYHAVLKPLIAELGPLRVMRPAERELRADLQELVDTGAVEFVPHEGWLSTTEQFRASHPKGAPWLLEKFYRYMREKTGVLMENGQPVGGRFNFDTENRRAWRGKPPAPMRPNFPGNPIKDEVGDLIASVYKHHPGTLDMDRLPATTADAELLWSWAKQECLTCFGEYEDAMTVRSSGLFHTQISALLNISRLLPRRVVGDVEALDIPIASKEGFIRQVLGWREFMHHVHEETDGFRNLPGVAIAPNGSAMPSALGADATLPPAYWGMPSGLNCLDTVVSDVWREGYSHHITRLMVLSNFATLIDVSPRQLTDWFWEAYIDAYDWVVEPNVLGLGTFGTGRLFTTKPYVSGSNYIRKMSDYCDTCQFHPGTTCPYSPLYWAFLERHRDLLESNTRLQMPYQSLKMRKPSQEYFVQIRDALDRGETLRPAAVR